MSDENHVEETQSDTPSPARGEFLGCGCLAWAIIGLCGSCFTILVLLLLPLFCSAREAARRLTCRCNIKQITLSLHNYNAHFDCFPPAYTVDEQGKPMHSWRALILPFLGFTQDEDMYDFDQPWDSPHNLEFAKKSTAHMSFSCPSESRNDDEQFNTSYVWLVGPNAFGDGTTCRQLTDITDGTSNTIMVGEMAHSGILWTEPRDLNVADMSFKLNDPGQIGLRSDHISGLHVGLCDGSVRWLNDNVASEVIQAMTTINGKEDVGQFD